MLLERVKSFIVENNLIEKGDTVVVGLSGGADSAALTHILYCLKEELSFKLAAAHIHHGIRGDEADRDMQFAKSFCESLGIEFHLHKCDIPKIAGEKKISEETAGREERYKFFASVAEKYENALIATAHNKNDNAETVLHRIIRGGGGKGLCGIPAKRDNIIRPLITVLRSDIEKYCEENGITYVTDSTNSEEIYTRNRIRKNVIPEMQVINPKAVTAVCRMSDTLCTDNDFLEKEAKKAFEKCVCVKSGRACYDLKTDLHTALKRRVFIMMAESVSCTLDFDKICEIERMIKKGATGRKINITGGVAEISYNTLVIGKETEAKPFCYLYGGKPLYIPECGITVKEEAGGIAFPQGEIFIRSRKDGDKIKVGGMTKKVKDIFIANKIPREKRNITPLVTVNGEVAYIYGLAKSDILKTNDKNGKTVVLNFIQKEYNNE